jgi:hypothetical protein
MAYRAPGSGNVHPLDAALNLPEEKQSHGLRKLAAIESARGSFDEAAAAITRGTGVNIGKRQVEELARRAAATPPGTDGPARSRGPQATGKWLTASVTEDIPAVIAAAFYEAGRRDPGHRRTWIALMDGNRTQIEVITAEAARRGITVTVICDFVHVLEYTWKAAWSFSGKGDPDAESWVGAQAAKILQGKAAQVAAGIRRRATTFGYSAAERDGADACADYLTAKKPHLDYATALAKADVA